MAGRFGKDGRATLPGAFFEAVSRGPDRPLFTAKRDGRWQGMDRREAADRVRRLAGFLAECGIAPGDRVVIAAENGPEWAIADLAVMTVGAVVVPAYTTNTAADHAHIMGHSGAVMAMVSPGTILERVFEAAAGTKVRQILVLDGDAPLPGGVPDGIAIARWPEAMAAEPAGTGAMVDAIEPGDTCCLIYTSGTGGRPKGVMLSHASIQANIDGAMDLLAEGGAGRGQRFLSLLPLSHAYEHTAGLHLPIQSDAEIWYCEGAEQIAANLAEASPTLMTAVPRLYEVLHERIRRGVAQKGGLSAKLFELAVETGRRRLAGGRRPLDRLVDPVLDILVRRKVRRRLGGRLRYFVSGGAALNPDIGTFFLALGVNILQGYGQTEASPVISANRPSRIKIDTVGPALRGVEVRTSDDGEILVRGQLLMKGYWRDDAATREAIRDGWLHTGDLGSVDADGYITITGRAKEIIVNSGGDNIAPVRVEGILALEPEIGQVMVDGDARPWLAAVVVPGEELLEGKDPKTVEAAVAAAVERANAGLSATERVRRFILADEPFTTENGQMTATLKTRRHVVRDVYGARLDALYSSGGKRN